MLVGYKQLLYPCDMRPLLPPDGVNILVSWTSDFNSYPQKHVEYAQVKNAPIESKHKFIQIRLKVPFAYAVIGSIDKCL